MSAHVFRLRRLSAECIRCNKRFHRGDNVQSLGDGKIACPFGCPPKVTDDDVREWQQNLRESRGAEVVAAIDEVDGGKR